MSESEKSARMNIVWIHCSPAEPPPAASSGCTATQKTPGKFSLPGAFSYLFLPNIQLFEVLYATLKQLQILLTIDVDCYRISDTL